MPDTGKVYYVDRMTNEYAERWPMNVNEFIMNVCKKWQESNVAEVQKYFDYGLGRMGEKHSTHCPAKLPDKVTKQGDIIIGKFPEQSCANVFALIEAWNKGAEYHTKGFRQGDVLPEKLPACKITRLDDGGWIALFPKDMGLLETAGEITQTKTPTPSVEPEVEPIVTMPEAEPIVTMPEVEPIMPKPARMPKPRRKAKTAQTGEGDLFGTDSPTPSSTGRPDEDDSADSHKKILAAVATVAVTLVLLNTVGFLGIAGIGLMAGGFLK